MKYNYIFWDWNGTLSNDAGAAYLAVNDMLLARNLPLITFEQYRNYIDVPIIRFYEKVMDMSREDMNAMSVEFNGLWSNHLDEYHLMVGASELLKKLSDLGIKQYIFSSSHNDYIIPILKKFDIFQYFTAVLGADDCFVGSKTERTKKYVIDNSIPIDRIVFIGDMVHDSQVADEIGADCVLVSYGHQAVKALCDSGRRVYSSLEELSEFLLT